MSLEPSPFLSKRRFMAIAISTTACLLPALVIGTTTISTPVMAASAAAPTATTKSVKRYTAAQFLETTNMRGASFSRRGMSREASFMAAAPQIVAVMIESMMVGT